MTRKSNKDTRLLIFIKNNKAVFALLIQFLFLHDAELFGFVSLSIKLHNIFPITSLSYYNS